MGREYPKIPLHKRPRQVRTWQSGSFTTASLAGSGTEDNTITHGLGSDNVMVLVMGVGGTTAEEWRVIVVRPDSSISTQSGGVAIAITAPTTPSAGDIIFRTKNGTTGAQTITINYLIIRSDEVVD